MQNADLQDLTLNPSKPSMSKMSQKFALILRLYEESYTGVFSRRNREREAWMGPREEDFARCEEAFTKLEQLWAYSPEDLESLRAVHRKYLDLYLNSRADEGEWVFKEIDELIDTLRDKWKNA